MKPVIKQVCENNHETSLEKRVAKCSCGKNLSFKIQQKVDFLGSINQGINSMWRFGNLLPVNKENIVSKGEGNTPIIYLKDLSDELGIRLYAKLETENPTGTFKDREASFVVSRSKEVGDDNLVLQSTGNTAVAVSYYAGLAGLSSWAFIPEISRYKLTMPDKNKKNRIIAVKGTPQQVKEMATRFADELEFPKISPFHERCEANVTQAYEVYEGVLRGNIPAPDHYVQVISAGMGPIGFFYGAKRISNWANIKIPKIVCVQNSEFAPMARALREGRRELGNEGLTPDYPTKNPFEPTLHTTNAQAYYKHIRQAIKESHGISSVISPQTAKKHGRNLVYTLNEHGFPLAETENASLIGYAGLVELVKKGEIPENSNVLLMVTGKSARISKHFEPDAIVPPDYDIKKLYKGLR